MSAQIDSLAQVYARSLFELAETAGGREKIEEIADELEQICEAARADRAFGEFLRSPIVEKSSRSKSISGIFSNRVTDLTLRFLLVLNDKERLNHLEGIYAAYDRMVQEAFGRVEVDVFTPSRLEAEQMDVICDRVRNALKKEPVLHPYTDPSMIGGIRLRIGDQLIDASVSTQIRRMRDQLMSGGSTALRERIGRMIEDQGVA